MRIGHGYDVHRLTENRKLILGGIEISYDKGLDGHSDADVLLHAIMDAMLGALAMGDIGQIFPDNDETYRGADSAELLKIVYEKISERAYHVENIDCTVIAQAPKLAGFVFAMRDKISKILKINVDCVSIKATTEEYLGFTGAGEGIAAHAVVLLDN